MHMYVIPNQHLPDSFWQQCVKAYAHSWQWRAEKLPCPAKGARRADGHNGRQHAEALLRFCPERQLGRLSAAAVSQHSGGHTWLLSGGA